MADSVPSIDLFAHTDCDDLDFEWLTAKAREALPHCLKSVGSAETVLPMLEEVEVSFVSDKAIAEVHGCFMDDPTPTDVITFHHGEILVSVDTARQEGPKHGHDSQKETLLYIIHGLLHLNGHTDLVESDREAMHHCQEWILELVTAN
jgi:probable rRNA maturation factor|tara:strand:- start:11016 stop:11459 length:444 start_codon:yes stop_codon:yes gene_type:complete